MENKLIFNFEKQLNDIDIENLKLDAIIYLKTWQKKMFLLIEKIYHKRLNEIDEITLNIINEIKEKQHQIQEQIKTNDKTLLLNLQKEIDQLKSDIIIIENIPENFDHLIERTIHVKHDENEDDDFVIINIDKNEEISVVSSSTTTTHQESRVSKIIHSEPVQQALTATLTQTLTHLGVVAATSTTTLAATTMAKTILLTTAYSLGKIAIGTSKKIWSFL